MLSSINIRPVLHQQIGPCFLLALLLLVATPLMAQPKAKKLKDVTFKANSTAFADANMDYDYNQGQYRYLSDSIILDQLLKIMTRHKNLVIEVGGHTDLEEKEELGLERAKFVRDELIFLGIDPDRLTAKGYGFSDPKIPQRILDRLDLEEERAAAHQKNRRASFKVVRTNYPTE